MNLGRVLQKFHEQKNVSNREEKILKPVKYLFVGSRLLSYFTGSVIPSEVIIIRLIVPSELYSNLSTATERR